MPYNPKDIFLQRRTTHETFEEHPVVVQPNSVLVTDQESNLVMMDTGSFLSASFAGASVSYAVSSSDAAYAVSSSHALVADNAATASYAVSSSFEVNYETSSSYADEAISASHSEVSDIANAISFVPPTAGNATWASSSVSASHILGNGVQGPVTDAVNATSASYALDAEQAYVAAFSDTASIASNAFFASSSVSASYTNVSDTASYVLNAVSASYADTINETILNPFPTEQDVYSILEGYTISQSLSASQATSASYVPDLYPQVIQTTVASASWVSASARIINSDTASYVLNAVSASYAPSSPSISASFASSLDSPTAIYGGSGSVDGVIYLWSQETQSYQTIQANDAGITIPNLTTNVLTVSTTVNAQGPVTASGFKGDGSQLTNITASNINGVVANALSASYASSSISASYALSAWTASNVFNSGSTAVTSEGILYIATKTITNRDPYPIQIMPGASNQSVGAHISMSGGLTTNGKGGNVEIFGGTGLPTGGDVNIAAGNGVGDGQVNLMDGSRVKRLIISGSSMSISASVVMTGSIQGDLIGTASHATYAETASLAGTADYATIAYGLNVPSFSLSDVSVTVSNGVIDFTELNFGVRANNFYGDLSGSAQTASIAVNSFFASASANATNSLNAQTASKVTITDIGNGNIEYPIVFRDDAAANGVVTNGGGTSLFSINPGTSQIKAGTFVSTQALGLIGTAATASIAVNALFASSSAFSTQSLNATNSLTAVAATSSLTSQTASIAVGSLFASSSAYATQSLNATQSIYAVSASWVSGSTTVPVPVSITRSFYEIPMQAMELPPTAALSDMSASRAPLSGVMTPYIGGSAHPGGAVIPTLSYPYVADNGGNNLVWYVIGATNLSVPPSFASDMTHSFNFFNDVENDNTGHVKVLWEVSLWAINPVTASNVYTAGTLIAKVSHTTSLAETQASGSIFTITSMFPDPTRVANSSSLLILNVARVWEVNQDATSYQSQVSMLNSILTWTAK